MGNTENPKFLAVLPMYCDSCGEDSVATFLLHAPSYEVAWEFVALIMEDEHELLDILRHSVPDSFQTADATSDSPLTKAGIHFGAFSVVTAPQASIHVVANEATPSLLN